MAVLTICSDFGWNLLCTGIDVVAPALQDRLLTTGPPGKPPYATAAGNAHFVRSWVPKDRHPVGAVEGGGPQVRELGLRGSCLENPMDRGAWRATVHRVAERQSEAGGGVGGRSVCTYKEKPSPVP